MFDTTAAMPQDGSTAYFTRTDDVHLPVKPCKTVKGQKKKEKETKLTREQKASLDKRVGEYEKKIRTFVEIQWSMGVQGIVLYLLLLQTQQLFVCSFYDLLHVHFYIYMYFFLQADWCQQRRCWMRHHTKFL